MDNKDLAQNLDVANAQQPKPRHKWRRRILRTLLVMFVLLLLTVAAAIIWLGPIAERYVENNDKEYVGRRLEMDDLRLKLFEGHASVDNLVLYEADDTTHFVSIEHLEMDMELSELFDNHVHVSRVVLRNPELRIDQDVDSFNFDDMLAFIIESYLTEEDVEEDEEGEPWVVTIEDVTLEGGALAYHDLELDQRWDITELSLYTADLKIEDAMTDVETSMVINEEATLGGLLQLNIDNYDFVFDGQLSGFSLADTYKYVVSSLNVRDLRGCLTADVDLEGNIMDIMAMNISGDISAENFGVSGPDGGNVFSANTMSATISDLNLEAGRYIFDSITADGYATQLCFDADGGTNFDMLFYGEPEVSVETTTTNVGGDMYDVRERVTVTTSSEEAPLQDMTLHIGTLRLRSGSLHYADNTMHEPFSYDLSNINIESNNFDMMSENTLVVRAGLEHQGTALIRWTGSLNDFYNQSVMAMLTNVDMQDLSTYVEHYTAFPVTSGNLTFRSQNVIANGELNGVNQLGTYQFQVGDKDRDMETEFNLPLKLGVYVLTDRNDHIDIDLPITGHIEDPEFSYKKIILKAIGNLLLKVAAAPFEWMSGDKQDAFRHINIDALSMGLDSEQYARLDAMAQALKDDPNIQVRLTQRVNYNRAVRNIADMNLKMSYYNATQVHEGEFLDMLDFSRIEQMRLSGDAVNAYADSLLLQRGIDPSHMNIHAKAMALYGDVIDNQLTQMMSRRNRVISDYMSFQHADIPAGAFSINEVVLDDIRNYSSRDRYTVTLIIGDEEVEIVAEDEDVEESAEEVAETAAEDTLEVSGTEVVEEHNFTQEESLTNDEPVVTPAETITVTEESVTEEAVDAQMTEITE